LTTLLRVLPAQCLLLLMALTSIRFGGAVFDIFITHDIAPKGDRRILRYDCRRYTSYPFFFKTTFAIGIPILVLIWLINILSLAITVIFMVSDDGSSNTLAKANQT
jgi:hypothetical protein